MIFFRDLVVKSKRNYFLTFIEKVRSCSVLFQVGFFSFIISPQLRVMGELYIMLKWTS